MGTVKQEELLTRIAEALESIDKTLSDELPAINGNLSDVAEMLEGIDRNLNNCISRYGNNSFLCITGNVSTY